MTNDLQVHVTKLTKPQLESIENSSLNSSEKLDGLINTFGDLHIALNELKQRRAIGGRLAVVAFNIYVRQYITENDLVEIGALWPKWYNIERR